MNTTIKDFESVCEAIANKRLEVDAKKIELSAINSQLEELEAKAQAMLETNEIDSYKSAHGTVYLSTYESVKMPQDLEAKEQFFSWLKSKGLYDEMVSVNSQKLNGLYRKEKEAEMEKGNMFFTIPGLGEPVVSPRLGFRKK